MSVGKRFRNVNFYFDFKDTVIQIKTFLQKSKKVFTWTKIKQKFKFLRFSRLPILKQNVWF